VEEGSSDNEDGGNEDDEIAHENREESEGD